MHHRTLCDFLQSDDGIYVYAVAVLCEYVYERRGNQAAIRTVDQSIYRHDCAAGCAVSAGGRDHGAGARETGPVLFRFSEADLFFLPDTASDAGERGSSVPVRAGCGCDSRDDDDGSVFEDISGDSAGDRKS